jgi:hypothetical protein
LGRSALSNQGDLYALAFLLFAKPRGIERLNAAVRRIAGGQAKPPGASDAFFQISNSVTRFR